MIMIVVVVGVIYSNPEQTNKRRKKDSRFNGYKIDKKKEQLPPLYSMNEWMNV